MMGADGGINWVHVTGDKDEFYNLVRPLGLLYYKSYHDEYHDDYVEKHNPVPEAKEGFYQTSTYGTNQETQGLDDLEEIIRELKWYKRPSKQPFDNVWGNTNPLDLTWMELLTEYHTNDYWKTQNLWSLPSCMRVMVHANNWLYDKDIGAIKEKYKEYDNPTFYITLREWLDRLLKVVNIKSFGSVETWT